LNGLNGLNVLNFILGLLQDLLRELLRFQPNLDALVFEIVAHYLIILRALGVLRASFENICAGMIRATQRPPVSVIPAKAGIQANSAGN
jgi:hypothetical protein